MAALNSDNRKVVKQCVSLRQSVRYQFIQYVFNGLSVFSPSSLFVCLQSVHLHSLSVFSQSVFTVFHLFIFIFYFFRFDKRCWPRGRKRQRNTTSDSAPPSPSCRLTKQSRYVLQDRESVITIVLVIHLSGCGNTSLEQSIFMLRHCRHVGGQKQYIFSLGNKIYFHAKLFHCFSPPTWLP